MWGIWIVRLVLFVVFLPLILPLGALMGAFAIAPIPIALLLLAMALLALAIVFGLILGVLGTLIDVLIVFLLLGLVWKWPRGIHATPSTKRSAWRTAASEGHSLNNSDTVPQRTSHCVSPLWSSQSSSVSRPDFSTSFSPSLSCS